MSDTFWCQTPLETTRLRIRPFEPLADLAAMTAVYCDPEVMRYIPGGALQPTAVRGLLEKHRADNESDLGFYGLEEQRTGQLVGEVGFAIFATGEREIGWTLARPHWGRGYATEAVRACLAVRAVPLVAAIDRENAASIRVAERAGLLLRGPVELNGRPHVVYET